MNGIKPDHQRQYSVEYLSDHCVEFVLGRHITLSSPAFACIGRAGEKQALEAQGNYRNRSRCVQPPARGLRSHGPRATTCVPKRVFRPPDLESSDNPKMPLPAITNRNCRASL